MSFSDLLNKAVKSVFVSYAETLSKKYNIPKDELVSLFEGTSDKSPVPDKPSIVQESSELSKLSKNELVAHCKIRGLKTTGTKQDLLGRLTSETKQPPKKESTSQKAVETIQKTISAIQIKKNSFGNFEHGETGFVFDRATQKVIGKQNKNGHIDNITDSDIEICNKYKFKFEIPEDLNVGVKASVAIDGLEDEEPGEDDGTDIINEAEEMIEEEFDGEEEELLEEDD